MDCALAFTPINLEGGGSTTLYLHGYPENGIVNYPTDNNHFDHKGERKVSNVIMIMEKIIASNRQYLNSPT